MKEKSKKVLKGFGVGALACLGMFGLTGCANIDVSQKKVDSLIERFEEFSEKVTREEALNIFHTALYNSYFYENGYDNVTIDYESNGATQTMMLYSNSQMLMGCSVQGNSAGIFYYDDATGKHVYADFFLTNRGYTCTNKSTLEYFGDSRYGQITPFPFSSFDESLYSYELLENGNYSLLFVEEENETIELEEDEEGEYTITTYITIEITKDAKIISIKGYSEVELDFECDQQTWEEEFEYLVGRDEITYTYGTVDVELMQELYELAQAAPETPGEGEE